MSTVRGIAVVASALLAVASVYLGVNVLFADGVDWVDVTRIVLLGVATAWIAWGAMLAILGLLTPPRVQRSTGVPLQGRTALVMPIYNEDPVKTFSHIAAMIHSIKATGQAAQFECAILSDTRDEAIAERETQWFTHLRDEVGTVLPLYYRRRATNTGRKAGNIEDFVATSGGRYDHMVILDADSLMEGDTIVELARRMEAEPDLGLLQTLPSIVRARSFFGRAMQFSAALYSPIFTRGLESLQGREGPFWGHNAIVRTRAFAQSCGLPKLPGRPPLGGHILSHDYVEAALLARAGWTVRVDSDLVGSFEETPGNVIDYAKRDRRWCQGNLQHLRILGAPGLKAWNRFTLVQGIMAYLAASIWGLFLVATIVAPIFTSAYDYFPEPTGIPVFPISQRARAIALVLIVLLLLIGPKVLTALHAALSGRARAFGGIRRVVAGTVTEILWSSLLAPIMLVFQSRALAEVLTGLDVGWPATNRNGDEVSFAESFRSSWWISLTGLVVLVSAWSLESASLWWFAPVGLPLLLAPWLISSSSTERGGARARAWGLFETPEELGKVPVLREQSRIHAAWRQYPETAEPGDTPPPALLATVA